MKRRRQSIGSRPGGMAHGASQAMHGRLEPTSHALPCGVGHGTRSCLDDAP